MLSPSNYPTHQQQTRAIIEAMAAFAPHLLHRQFTEVTDHKGLTKLMTQKNLNGREHRWLTHISRFDFKIEYPPGAKNFLAAYLSRIPEGTSGPLDISLKDPTIGYDSLELPDPTQPLQMNTSYTSSTDLSIESHDVMYLSGETQTSATLTRSDAINHGRPEYLMDEISSNAVTHSCKRKASPSSPATFIAASNDSRLSIETLGMITELSRSVVKWNHDTQK